MSEAVEHVPNLGILAFLDPEYRARHEAARSEDDRRRDYAAERLSAVYGCSRADARAWLDWDDAEAIERANRLLTAEPYTDIEGTYH